MTNVRMNTWNPKAMSPQPSEIQIILLSYLNFSLSVNNWMSIQMSQLALICPKCNDIYLKFSSVNLVNLSGIFVSVS